MMLSASAATWCLRGFWLFVGVLLLTGCITKTLDIGYDGSQTGPGALASLPAQRVTVPPVTDKRVAADGARVHNIVFASRSVPDVVREAVVIEVKGNGHTVVNEGGDLVFAVDVEKLWANTVTGFWTVQVVGVASIGVTVVHGRTGRILASRTYHGVHREIGDDNPIKTTLRRALGRVVREMGTDETLARALRGAAE